SNGLFDNSGEQTTNSGQTKCIDLLGRKLASSLNLNGDWGGVDKLASKKTKLASQIHPHSNLFAHATTGNVHSIRHELASQRLEHGISNISTRTILSLFSRSTQVRSHNNLRQLEQRRISARLGGVHIETSATNVTGLNRISQSLLINKATTS